MREKGRVIDINDDTAKILAQVLTNDKALAILHALEESPKSISELAAELGFPISTVSYHIDKLLKVGLVEVAGIKYGQKLQEVKLYKASNRPILLVSKKESEKLTKKLSTIEKLRIISLSVASLISSITYLASKRIFSTTKTTKIATAPINETIKTMTSGTPSRFIITNSSTSTTSQLVQNYTTISSKISWENLTAPLLIAVVTFILTFVLIYYGMRKKIPKRF
ncbi:ArsR/SmtB family transcription factor [Thermococcus sp.]